MLAKEKRLNLTKQFKWVAAGNRLESKNYKIFYRFGQNTNPLVGISLSKKEIREAHDRNRARRITSKAVENIFLRLHENLNLVIMPKSTVLQTSVSDLEKELTNEKFITVTN